MAVRRGRCVATPCTKTSYEGFTNFSWSERLAAASPGSLWLLCGTEPGVGEQPKLVERSFDAGRTWKIVAAGLPDQHVPSDDIPLLGSIPEAGATGTFVAVSSKQAWLVIDGDGAGPVLLRTTDGGRSWPAGAPAGVEEQFPEQVAVAGRRVIVKTEDGLWSTHDDVHWRLLAGRRGPHETVRRSGDLGRASGTGADR